MNYLYFGWHLSSLVARVPGLQQVRKVDLQSGDRVIVITTNSVYRICVEKNGVYAVSGGWFDNKGLSPMKTTITGCSWGGSVIKVDVVAACGLRLEFGNRLVTSVITKIIVLPRCMEN
jgi:hypothetical protein